MFWKKEVPVTPMSNETLLETIPSVVATLETLTEQNKIVWDEWAVRGFKASLKIRKLSLDITVYREYAKDGEPNENGFSNDYHFRLIVSKNKGDTHIERNFVSPIYKNLYNMAEHQEKINEKLREQKRNAEFFNILTELLTKIINSK